MVYSHGEKMEVLCTLTQNIPIIQLFEDTQIIFTIMRVADRNLSYAEAKLSQLS